MFVGFDRAGAAAATVWSVTVIVAKKTAVSGEKVVNPFRDNDALVRSKT